MTSWKTKPLITIAALVLAVLGGLVSCGDDDGGEDSAFCDQVNETNTGTPPDEVLDEIQESAPDEVRDDVETLVGAIEDPANADPEETSGAALAIAEFCGIDDATDAT